MCSGHVIAQLLSDMFRKKGHREFSQGISLLPLEEVLWLLQSELAELPTLNPLRQFIGSWVHQGELGSQEMLKIPNRSEKQIEVR